MIIKSDDYTPITVAIADSNPLVLSALSEVFEKDSRFSVVTTTANSEGFLRMVKQVPVQIGVVDWNLSSIGAKRLIEVLQSYQSAPRVVMYADESVELARQSMLAGAAGFASRAAPVEKLLEICVSVAAGKMIFPFLDIRKLQQDPIQQLSPRERTMFRALSTGMTNRELAAELGISSNTVKFHLSNLYEKLSVKNRAQAIAFYYANREELLKKDQEPERD